MLDKKSSAFRMSQSCENRQALMQETSELPMLIQRGQNGNRIENLRAFGHRKIGPEDTMHKEPTPPLPPRLQLHRVCISRA